MTLAGKTLKSNEIEKMIFSVCRGVKVSKGAKIRNRYIENTR